MRLNPPQELARLLQAVDETAQNEAWTGFTAAYSQLLLHVARSITKEHDAALDCYTYVLEKLREDRFHRLRTYAADGRGKFTTWLVVVARRLALDFHRQRYGRAPDTVSSQRASAQEARRRLVDLYTTDIDLASLAASSDESPDGEVRKLELSEALTSVLTRLAPNDQLLIKLRFEDGLGGNEIAKLVRLPSAFHVYRRLNRILREMRERLRQRGVQDSLP